MGIRPTYRMQPSRQCYSRPKFYQRNGRKRREAGPVLERGAVGERGCPTAGDATSCPVIVRPKPRIVMLRPPLAQLRVQAQQLPDLVLQAWHDAVEFRERLPQTPAPPLRAAARGSRRRLWSASGSMA